MAKKQNGIPCDEEMAERLRLLSEQTKRSQIGILREFITHMSTIAASFESCGYWLDESGSQISIQFYGKSKMDNGEIPAPSCLGDKVNDILNEKALENVMDVLASQTSKVQKTQVTQKVGVRVSGKVRSRK